MKKNIVKFNDEFLIGSATSGPQTEGSHNLDNKSDSVWDYLYSKSPERFFEQSFVKSKVRNNFKKYIDKAYELGLNSLRTSIQWSRLIPDGKIISKEAVRFYKEYFLYIKSRGIKLMVSLHHFDMPMWLYKKGGFEQKEAINQYLYYANKCYSLFGDIVDYWFSFNEPMVPVEMGYMNQFQLPGVINVKKGMQVMHNSLIAHMKAYDSFKKMNFKSKMGIILNITPVIPRSKKEKDLLAAEYAEQFFYKCFLDPMFKGEYPKLIVKHAKANGYMWEITKDEQKILASKQELDILGLNYYQPRRVKALDKKIEFSNDKSLEGQLFENYKYPKAIINKHRGWEIYPKGIYDMLMNIKDNYGNPKCFIAENGIGIEGEDKFKKDEVIQDDYRINFLKDHLNFVHKAISQGSNCIGYHIWTFVDNWSWLNAYKNRYGLVELNIDKGKMINKKSFNWFKNFSEKGEL